MVKTKSLKDIMRRKMHYKNHNIRFYSPRERIVISKEGSFPVIYDAATSFAGVSGFIGIFVSGFLSASHFVWKKSNQFKELIDRKNNNKYIEFRVKEK